MSKVPSQLIRFRQAPLLMPIHDVAELLVTAANDGNEMIERMTGMLVASRPKPPPKKLHQWLDGIVAGLPISQTLVFEGGEWQFGHMELRPSRHATKAGNTDAGLADAELLAVGMVRVLMEGYDKRLHRCELEDCGTYFVGDPRAKWCSTTCGSTARMRLKRRRDRQ
jgi:hypothetical protein